MSKKQPGGARYEDIKPNHRTSPRATYYAAIRYLRKLERKIAQAAAWCKAYGEKAAK